MQDNDLPQIGTPMQTDETRAREVLAAQLEADGFLVSARKLRAKGEMANGWLFASSIRAMLAFAAPPAVEREGLMQAAINQNDAMRQELAHVGNLVSDLARAMGVDQANADGSWPDLAARIQLLQKAALATPQGSPLHPSDREEGVIAGLDGVWAWIDHLPQGDTAQEHLNAIDAARSAILALSGSLAPEGGEKS